MTQTNQEAYSQFKSECPTLRVTDPRSQLVWEYHASGPSSSKEALVFIHGISGSASVFFQQVQALAAKGYRTVSVQWPAYGRVIDWLKGFDRFLDIVGISKVHLIGADLGGFLVQHFASTYTSRVMSMVLLNSYTTNEYYVENAPYAMVTAMLPFMPHFVLKKFIVDEFPTSFTSMRMKQAVDFIAGKLDDLDAEQLAARLCIQGTSSTITTVPMRPEGITIIEPQDNTMLPKSVREAQRATYPGCRVAELKDGGDFCYLVRGDEVAMHIELHMRAQGCWGPEGQPQRQETDYERVNAEEEARVMAQRAAWRNPFDDADVPRPDWSDPMSGGDVFGGM